MRSTLNFAVNKLSASRRPCRGVRLQSRVRKLAPLLCKFWRYKYSTSGLHAFYCTYCPDYGTSFPKKLENSATEKTTASCAFPDCSSPSPPLLMSVIGQNAIQSQAMVKTLTGKCMTFKHIGRTSFGRVSGNIKCSTNT